jgi:predicted MFS family arabinose efflux permease
MWTYYGAFYLQQHALTTQQIGWVSLAAGLGVLLGRAAAGGRLGGRPRRLFLIGCLGSGLLIGLSLLLLLPAPAAVALMAAGWLMHGLIMVSTVILLVGQSSAGWATTLTLYAAAMNLASRSAPRWAGSRWHRLAMSPSACAPWPCHWCRPSSSGAATVSRRRHQHRPVRGVPTQGGT